MTVPAPKGQPPESSTAAGAGRLGVLGGTFDPIHLGHLALAEEAREVLGLERVLFVPAGDPWQKAGRSITPAATRLAMVERAIVGNPAFSASRMEIDREGPSYAADTLAALSAAAVAGGRAPDLWFILSIEALRGLHTWHEPERVLALARLAVAPRGSTDPAPILDAFRRAFPAAEGRLVLLDGPRLEISSTAIRQRVAAGRSVRYLVPDSTASAIREYALYRSPAAPAAGPSR